MMDLKPWKPAVSKAVLLLLAGGVWLGVGCMLLFMSCHWLKEASLRTAGVLGVSSFGGGLIVHHLGFLRIVNKNLQRIDIMAARPCLFAFMPVRSYLLVVIMILMGAVLRHSSLPKLYLAVPYMVMGTALFLSSIRYFRILMLFRERYSCPVPFSGQGRESREKGTRGRV